MLAKGKEELCGHMDKVALPSVTLSVFKYSSSKRYLVLFRPKAGQFAP